MQMLRTLVARYAAASAATRAPPLDMESVNFRFPAHTQRERRREGEKEGLREGEVCGGTHLCVVAG